MRRTLQLILAATLLCAAATGTSYAQQAQEPISENEEDGADDVQNAPELVDQDVFTGAISPDDAEIAHNGKPLSDWDYFVVEVPPGYTVNMNANGKGPLEITIAVGGYSTKLKEGKKGFADSYTNNTKWNVAYFILLHGPGPDSSAKYEGDIELIGPKGVEVSPGFLETVPEK